LLIDADKNEFMNVFLSLLRSLFYQLNWTCFDQLSKMNEGANRWVNSGYFALPTVGIIWLTLE